MGCDVAVISGMGRSILRLVVKFPGFQGQLTLPIFDLYRVVVVVESRGKQCICACVFV